MTRASDASIDLLFGLLALQNGLIDQAQLVAAFQAWTLDKARPLAEHLVAMGHLDADDRTGRRRPGRPAPQEARRRRREEPGRHPGRPLDPREPRPPRRRRRRGHPRPPSRREPSTHDGDADRPTPGRTASYAVGTATSDGQRFRILRPHARGGLGAVFVALDPSCTARWRSSRSSTTTPTTRPAAPASCSRPRSPAGWSIPASSRSTAWAPTPTAGPTTPCGSSAATASRRPSPPSTPTTPCAADPGPASPGTAQAPAAVPGRLQRDRLRPQPGRPAPRPQAGQRHPRQARRDAGGGLGTGQGDRADRARRRLRRARCWSRRSSSGSAETLPGSALGTPAYMSPEQAGGDLERLGPRSDVYSLGATLYCLLTGRPPVEDDDVGAVLRAVQKGDFPPPRRLDPAIDPALEAVCLKAMALTRRGPLCHAAGAGRGHRALDGRRAGVGLARAAGRGGRGGGSGGTARR